MCVWRVVRWFIICCVLVIMASEIVVSAQEYVPDDKRSPADRQSWFLGSRYGRSSTGTRHVIVTPRRDDRFYPGSRYGKRAFGTSSSPITSGTVGAINTKSRTITAITQKDEHMQCIYTGITDLYRCHIRRETANEDFLSN